MAEVEAVGRVGLAAWFEELEHLWDTPPVLGTIGDDLFLLEIDASNRERAIVAIVDGFDVHERSLRIEIAFFGESGGFFASSMNFLEHWPKVVADVPAEVFIDERYKAALANADGEIIVSVRHVLRPDRPPQRELRFRLNAYEEAMSRLTQESRQLRDDVIRIARERAPQKVEALLEAFSQWPA